MMAIGLIISLMFVSHSMNSQIQDLKRVVDTQEKIIDELELSMDSNNKSINFILMTQKRLMEEVLKISEGRRASMTMDDQAL
jgi:cell division protein FtsL